MRCGALEIFLSIRHSQGAFLLAFLARQASEQYNTESQFLAHAFRHVIVRPHTAQSLLGSVCLLPLKSFFILGFAVQANRSPCPDGVGGASTLRLGAALRR